MTTRRSGLVFTAAAALALATLCGAVCTAAQSDRPAARIAVPVVMETATVRGKVVMLEDRKTDRQVLKDLKIAVWTTKKTDESGEPSTEPDKLVRETTTDEFGMFDLPLLPEGNYVLVVSELELQLVVLPKAEEPKTDGPKVEAPKAEDPKAESPKVENPKAEGPKAEGPKSQGEPKILLILMPKEVVAP